MSSTSQLAPFFTAGVGVPHVVDQAWLLSHAFLEVTLDVSFLFNCTGKRSYTYSTDEQTLSRNGQRGLERRPDEALVHKELHSWSEKVTRKQQLLFLTEMLEELHPQQSVHLRLPRRLLCDTSVGLLPHVRRTFNVLLKQSVRPSGSDERNASFATRDTARSRQRMLRTA